MKHSNPLVMIESYRLLAEVCDYPLHLGVTEAGPMPLGGVKSAVGIGTLLAEGIGDTIRVSLTDDPVEEVKVGTTILRSLGLRKRGLDLVACPSCGRAEVNVLELTQKVNAAIEKERFSVPMRVAVMGCVVNGPGEAREADVGIASGNGLGFIIRQGEVVAKVPEASSSTPCSPRRARWPPRRPPPASVPTSPNPGAAERAQSADHYGPIHAAMSRARAAAASVAAVAVVAMVMPSTAGPAGRGPVPGTTCEVFPVDNVWRMDVSALPKHPKSQIWKRSSHAGSTDLHPDFGPPAYGILVRRGRRIARRRGGGLPVCERERRRPVPVRPGHHDRGRLRPSRADARPGRMHLVRALQRTVEGRRPDRR